MTCMKVLVKRDICLSAFDCKMPLNPRRGCVNWALHMFCVTLRCVALWKCCFSIPCLIVSVWVPFGKTIRKNEVFWRIGSNIVIEMSPAI